MDEKQAAALQRISELVRPVVSEIQSGEPDPRSTKVRAMRDVREVARSVVTDSTQSSEFQAPMAQLEQDIDSYLAAQPADLETEAKLLGAITDTILVMHAMVAADTSPDRPLH